MTNLLPRCTALLLFVVGMANASEATQSPQALYAQYCAACHDQPNDARMPGRIQLSRMNPLALLGAMETGSMRLQAQAMSPNQKRRLAEGLTRQSIGQRKVPDSAFCSARQAPITNTSISQWSGWGNAPLSLGYAADAVLNSSSVAGLELSWAYGFPGASQARSQPAVVADVAFVGGAEGTVSALDTHSGCLYWRTQTSAAIRGSIVFSQMKFGTAAVPRPVVFAAAANTQTYALDARSGEILWQTRAAFHPFHSVTGTPVLHADMLYVPISSMEVSIARSPDHTCCVSSGGVVALNALDGSEIWRMRATGRQAQHVGHSAGKEVWAPSGAPVWASPTVDAKRGLLYVGTGENYSRPATLTSDAILALSLATGEVAWSFQATPDDAWHSGCSRMPEYSPCDNTGPDLDFGMAPIIATTEEGRDILLAGQKSAVVFALDPDSQGKVLWQRRVGKGGALGGIHWGMATDNKQVYVTNADRPSIIKDVNPGTKLAPGVYALDIESGAINWQMRTPGPICSLEPGAPRGCITANSAAPTVVNDVVFAGDLYGVLRAYRARDGKVLWEYDTRREYTTTNAVAAKGGSIDGPGVVAANGRLFVNSGYGMFRQHPGNVMLSFTLPTDPAEAPDAAASGP